MVVPTSSVGPLDLRGKASEGARQVDASQPIGQVEDGAVPDPNQDKQVGIVQQEAVELGPQVRSVELDLIGAQNKEGAHSSDGARPTCEGIGAVDRLRPAMETIQMEMPVMEEPLTQTIRVEVGEVPHEAGSMAVLQTDGWDPVSDVIALANQASGRSDAMSPSTESLENAQVGEATEATLDPVADGSALEPSATPDVAACACDMTMFGAMQQSGRDALVVAHIPDDRLSNKEQVAIGNIKSFCARLLKKLAPPLLKEIETMRGVRAGQDPFTPRRTTRSVCSTNRSKSKATAAETVLLKTLGIAHDDLEVSEGALDTLRNMFDSPLQESQLRAIAAIFGKAMPINLTGEFDALVATSA